MSTLIEKVKSFHLTLTELWENVFVRWSLIVVIVVGTVIVMPFSFDQQERGIVRAGFFAIAVTIFVFQVKLKGMGKSLAKYFYDHWAGMYLALLAYFWTLKIWKDTGLDDLIVSLIAVLKQTPFVKDFVSDWAWSGTYFKQGELNYLSIFWAIIWQVFFHILYMRFSKPHEKQEVPDAVQSQ